VTRNNHRILKLPIAAIFRPSPISRSDGNRFSLCSHLLPRIGINYFVIVE
jgi:hypothetical protein